MRLFKKIYIESLGCPKNLVDSEVMIGVLEKQGFVVVAKPEKADILLVNTCGFIQSAVEEALDKIFWLGQYKKGDPDKLLVVTGCLVQRYGPELQKELKEVDLFTGTDDYDCIDELITRTVQKREGIFDLRTPVKVIDSNVPRRISTPSHRSYLKVTEGCDNHCTYCLIPTLRGRLRSRTVDDLLVEATRLEKMGVKELTLIAQDLTAYGNDLDDTGNLPALLRTLLESTTLPWLRLLYLYPDKITDELLAVMADSPRILPYLDIPFQHISSKVLKKMNRSYGRRELEDLIQGIRRNLPEIAIRTTLMVGFPGETEDDIEEMVSFLKEYRLDHVGVFQYADEEECAAYQYKDKCSEEIKKARYTRIMEIQAEISLQRQQRYVGQTLQVLVEGVSAETDLLLEGRTRFQAADIDGCVYINRGSAAPGDFVKVRITEAHPYDLVGEILES